MDGKNDRQEDAVKKSVMALNESSSDKTQPLEKTIHLDRAEVLEGAKEGEVFSIKSHKPISLSEKGRIINQQIKDIERGPIEVESPSTPTPLEATPEFDKAKAEWSVARANAKKLEEEYKTKYEAHIFKESKGFRGLANLPRRMFGFQPKLTDELQALKGASLIARREYKEAGKNLKETKLPNEENEKLAERYERMLAYHLVVGTQKRRLEAQQKAIGEAWGTSKLKPVMEVINKYKYARIGATAIGYGVLAGATGGVAAAVFGSGAYLGRVVTAMGLGASAGLGGQIFYVEAARKRLEEAKEAVGDDFFETDFVSADQKMGELTFEVSARQARVRTAAMAAGLGAGMFSAHAGTGVAGLDTPPSSVTELPGMESDVPEIPEAQIPEAQSNVELPGTGDVPEASPEPSLGTDVEPVIGHAESDVAELTRSSGSGVDRAPTIDQNPDTATAPDVEVKPKDYSLPPFSSVNDLPSQGIIESVPQAPIESPVVSENPNLTPMTQAEATATFGAVTGPSVESLVTSDTVTHTVQNGDNVWNILEGKGPDTNPIGGKSEVLPGMSLADRQAALDKLIEYAEQNPEFAKEVGVVKSGGDINRVYPGEEINVSMLDDKLRELLDNKESVSETIVPSEVEVEDMPVNEGTPPVEESTVVPYSETVPESTPIIPPPTPAISSSPMLDRVTYTPADSEVSVQEVAAPMPENIEGLKAIKEYVTGVEKSTSGFLFAGRPDVSGTFEAIKDLSIGEFKTLAASDNLQTQLQERGVSFDGFERWGETLQKQVQLIPANDNETVGNYVTRIASTNVRTA